MSTAINLLVIEDRSADFRLIMRHLEKHGLAARCHCVSNIEELEAAVEQGGWDAVLSDYNVPKLDFQQTLGLLQARHPDLPLILVSGSVGEEKAVDLLKLGVWDFVLKDSLTRLVPAIERALRDAADRRSRMKALELQKHLEEQVAQRVEELQNKNAELERFTYTVSHDLKTPLVTINTFLGFLEKDLLANHADDVAKDLGFIRSAATKMALLLEELLRLARSGLQINAPEEVTLQEIVKEALSLVAGQIAGHGVQVHVTQEPIWLAGDRVRLVEVFQNLIDNAVKFMGDQAAPRVEIGIEPADGDQVIFVRDNGKGIDPRYQAKVFGIFEKLDAGAPGSGMGLALVKRIVEQHGGKIGVESEGLGHGTTFRFTLAKTQLRQPAPALT